MMKNCCCGVWCEEGKKEAYRYGTMPFLLDYETATSKVTRAPHRGIRHSSNDQNVSNQPGPSSETC